MPKLGRIYKERGNRYFIQLQGGVRLYCDREHRSFHSREHAAWTLAQIQGEAERGLFDPDFYSKNRKSIYSFESYAEHWLGLCERKVELGKLSRDYVAHVRHYVKDLFIPHFGQANLAEIRGKDITAFYLSLEKSAKTCFNVMMSLHRLFKSALDDEVIQTIPKFPADLKASQLPEPETRWVDEETQERIFKEMDPDDLFFILFQACHGTRTGETRALQHGDLDLHNDVVTIARAFSGNELRHTKTKRIRTIPLDPVWKEIYQSRPRCIDPRQFVFLRNGKPYSESWARKKWNEACEKVGVKGVTFYEGTRHSIASQAACRGVSIYAIAKFLGHSNLSVTQRYARLDTDPLRQVLRKGTVQSIFSASCLQSKKGHGK